MVTEYSYTEGKNSGETSTMLHTMTQNGKTIQYFYDRNGNIACIDNTLEPGTCYDYDSLNQLIRERSLTEYIEYTYDNGGNILSRTNDGVTTGTWEYNDSNWKDLLTAYNGQTITYDEIGNPLTYRNGMNMTWENGRRLASLTKDSDSISYTYNADGIRTSKTVNGQTTEYVVDGSTILGEKLPNGGEIYYFFDENGVRYGFARGGNLYYYAYNGQGDVIEIYNSGGRLEAWYKYDSWGKVTEMGGNLAVAEMNPIRYRGYYYDTETGFYYLNSRYYDPEICRFINADDVVSSVGEITGYNVFAYAFNNPINMADSEGHWPDFNKLMNGLAVLATGVAAIATAAAVMATAVAALPAVALVTAATVTAGAICVTMGGYDMVESFTGQNAMKDALGEEFYYNTEAIATVGSASGMAALAPYVPQQNCFVEETPILAASGIKAIEEIQPGDRVWAADPETGEQSLKEVVQTFVNETDELVHVYVGGEEIAATPEHPFYVPQKGWTSAADLRAGDILVLVNGEYVTVEKIQHEILESPVKVYNFEVEDYHTYYAGENSVLVHNACKETGSYEIEFESGKNYAGKGSQKRMETSAKRISTMHKDPVVSTHWDPAPNTQTAFVDEYFKMAVRGVNNQNTYNKIWSPGRKIFYNSLSMW